MIKCNSFCSFQKWNPGFLVIFALSEVKPSWMDTPWDNEMNEWNNAPGGQPSRVPHLDHLLNTLRPRQNGQHFPDGIFKCISLKEKVWIAIKISLKFVPKGPINTVPTLVQIMAWRRPGEKPLSEPMMIWLLIHIWVTRPQWVKKVHEQHVSKLWLCSMRHFAYMLSWFSFP